MSFNTLLISLLINELNKIFDSNKKKNKKKDVLECGVENNVEEGAR